MNNFSDSASVIFLRSLAERKTHRHFQHHLSTVDQGELYWYVLRPTSYIHGFTKFYISVFHIYCILR